MTTSSTAFVTQLASSLQDAGIAKDLLTVGANGTLTYSGALQILQDVAARGQVTQAEFSSLQAIAANLNAGLSANSYVASAFTQLVEGSPANAIWTGGLQTSVSLGNLTVGSSQTQVNELVGKWLLGSDLPTAEYTSSSNTTLSSYAPQSMPLFGATGTPVTSDVSQGSSGDCVLCAAMIEYALQHPAQAATMVQSEGNGVYGVRFYVNGNQTWVTVNDDLPVTSTGNLYYDGAYSGTTPLWAPLVEKAYVQLVSSGEVPGLQALNSYAATQSVPPVVMENLTGSSAITAIALSSTLSAAQLAADQKIILNAFAAHDDVQLFTDDSTPTQHDASGKATLINDHAHALIGFDQTTGEFILQNPWGFQAGTQTYDTTFEMSIAQIAALPGTSFQIDNSGQVGPSAAPTDILIAAASQQVAAGETLSVSSTFHATSTGAASIAEYGLIFSGTGRLNLNGAVNLATSAQTAQGEVVVSAADLGKLTLTGMTGDGSLEVSGYDGSSWSPASQVSLAYSGTSAGIAPSTKTFLAGQTVSLSSLFSVTGTTIQNDTWYDVVVPAGGGAINLNGAKNVWAGTPPAGSYELTGASLSQVTYTAPSASGPVALQFDVYTGSSWAGWTTASISISGATAAGAAQDLANGQYGALSAVSDSAAHVFANLDALQTALSDGFLTSITLTDLTPATVSASVTEVAADVGAMKLISGNYQVAVTDTTANVAANLDALQSFAATGDLGSITLNSSSSVLSLTGTQLANDARVLSALHGTYSLVVTGASAAQAATEAPVPALATISVVDSAADVDANMGGLETLAFAQKLSGVTLTDAGIPTLALSQTQIANDAAALADISGYFNLSVSVVASGSISGLAGHALTVVLSGNAAQWSMTSSGDGASFSISNGSLTEHMNGVTALQFTDHTEIVASQTPTVAGAVSSAEVANLYAAVFARTPDVAGLAYYEGRAATTPGTGITTFAEWFLQSPEYTGNSAHNYAETAAGDAQFITDTYTNLLHRAPGASDVAWYQANVIAPTLANATPGTGGYTAAELLAHASILADFSASSEFLGDVAVTAQHPADAQHWLILI